MTNRILGVVVVVVAVGAAVTGWAAERSIDLAGATEQVVGPHPATEAVRATLAHRAACVAGSPVCGWLADAVPSHPPVEALAGVRYACVSDVAPGMPADLVAALTGRLTSGGAVSWDGCALRAADDAGAVAASAACLADGACDEVRVPVTAGDEVADAEWSRAGHVWVAVEPGAEGCAAVSLLPAVSPGPARAVATRTLGSVLR